MQHAQKHFVAGKLSVQICMVERQSHEWILAHFSRKPESLLETVNGDEYLTSGELWVIDCNTANQYWKHGLQIMALLTSASQN